MCEKCVAEGKLKQSTYNMITDFINKHPGSVLIELELSNKAIAAKMIELIDTLCFLGKLNAIPEDER